MRKSSFLSQMLKRFTEHEISRAAASLTYYLVFALFPFLVVLCALISRSDILAFLGTELSGLVPKQVLQLITSYIEHIERQSSARLILWGAALMLWSFYRAVSAVCAAMNKAWGAKRNKGILCSILHTGALTVFMALSILLFIAVLTFNEKASYLISYLFPRSAAFICVWSFLRYPILAFTLFFILCALFRYSSLKEFTLRQVMPGVIFSLVCWYFSSLLYAWYAANLADYSNIYGSLGAVIVLLLWLQLGSMALLLGAELNAFLWQKKAK